MGVVMCETWSDTRRLMMSSNVAVVSSVKAGAEMCIGIDEEHSSCGFLC